MLETKQCYFTPLLYQSETTMMYYTEVDRGVVSMKLGTCIMVKNAVQYASLVVHHNVN